MTFCRGMGVNLRILGKHCSQWPYSECKHMLGRSW